MKNIYLILLIFLLLSCQKNKNTFSINGNEKLKYDRIQLLNIDENYNDESFILFVKKLKISINDMNSEQFINLLSLSEFSMGYGGGNRDDFIETWNLIKNPKKSKIWNELKEVIRLGFYFSDNENCYISPSIFYKLPKYIFTTMPPHEWALIIENNVNVREKPSSNSRVINNMNYELVKVKTWNKKELIKEIINNEEYFWYQVILYNGQTGYIYGKFLRTIGDYRLYVKKINQKWEIIGFYGGV